MNDHDNTGIVTQTIPQMPGMRTGEVGVAGNDKPGPSVRTVAIPAAMYIAQEVGFFFLQSFFGVLAADGMGLYELAPAGDAMAHIANVSSIAIGPTVLALATELFLYLKKVRAARQ